MKLHEKIIIEDPLNDVRFVADIFKDKGIFYLQIQRQRPQDGEWNLTLCDPLALTQYKSSEEVYAYAIPLLQITCSLNRTISHPEYFRSPYASRS